MPITTTEKLAAAELDLRIQTAFLELQELSVGAVLKRIEALRELVKCEAADVAANARPLKPSRSLAARGVPTQERIEEAEQARKAG